MTQSFEERLFQAIKKDDTKAFKALSEQVRCGEFRLGRFPVLSLLYLYKSHGILSEYEEAFLKITNYEELGEPAEISKKFSVKAGKCLRLYLSEIISPLEMLLILDRTRHLKRIFSQTKPSAAVRERLKSIYSIKYSLEIKFEGDEIIIDRRPLSYTEKKKIATACLCSVIAVTVAIGVPVTTVSLIPKPVEGEVKKLSQIDFSSLDEYTLKKDIVLPENFTVEKVNCTIKGEGKKLIFSRGAALGELSGKISDVTIESTGEAIFTTISETAVIENVVINVSADITAESSTALIALTNYGTIDGVTVNVSGSVNAVASSEAVTSEFNVGGLVLNNIYKTVSYNKTYWGTIKNCTVNYSQFFLTGETSANAAFGGIVAVNSGYVQDCTVSGEINAQTFDIAGVCLANSGLLSGNLNEADLLQTSAETSWSPLVCGIVLSNTYVVEYCVNTGDISAISSCTRDDVEEGSEPTVTAAGIASISYGNINYSANEGNIAVTGCGTAYAAGISARSCAQAYNCVSSGNITITAQSVYAGGIFGSSEVVSDYFNVYWGVADSCISDNKITVNESNEACVGGIVGCVREMGVYGSALYWGGGVVNCYFTGDYLSTANYFGNIVGICASNIYENNSYMIASQEYHNFEGNYYINNSFTAFGAVVINNEEFVAADDKGAEQKDIEELQNTEAYKNILNALKK